MWELLNNTDWRVIIPSQQNPHLNKTEILQNWQSQTQVTLKQAVLQSSFLQSDVQKT